MPALKKFDANVARHVKLMNKNLCANLLRHEYIVTGRTKAKRAQAEIESFLAKALHQNKEHAAEPLALRAARVRALSYLQPTDKAELAPKVLGELSERYARRGHGFTRIIKLESRLGTDKAPMSVLELVDSDFEIKFWYTAKIVARLELQKLELDGLTRHNVSGLVQSRPDGEARFRAAVEECKVKFFSYDPASDTVTDADVRANLENRPSERFVEQAQHFSLSKKHPVKPRGERPEIAVPTSPFVEQA